MAFLEDGTFVIVDFFSSESTVFNKDFQKVDVIKVPRGMDRVLASGQTLLFYNDYECVLVRYEGGQAKRLLSSNDDFYKATKWDDMDFFLVDNFLYNYESDGYGLIDFFDAENPVYLSAS